MYGLVFLKATISTKSLVDFAIITMFSSYNSCLQIELSKKKLKRSSGDIAKLFPHTQFDRHIITFIIAKRLNCIPIRQMKTAG